MTKQEFVDQVADKSGLSKRDAAKAVDAFLDSVTETLKSGDSVTFTGFGKFSPQRVRARRASIPATGEKVRSRPPRCRSSRPAARSRSARARSSAALDPSRVAVRPGARRPAAPHLVPAVRP